MNKKVETNHRCSEAVKEGTPMTDGDEDGGRTRQGIGGTRKNPQRDTIDLQKDTIDLRQDTIDL